MIFSQRFFDICRYRGLAKFTRAVYDVPVILMLSTFVLLTEYDTNPSDLAEQIYHLEQIPAPYNLFLFRQTDFPEHI